MATIDTLVRLGLPLSFDQHDGIFVESKRIDPVLTEFYEYRTNPTTRRREKTLVERTLTPQVTIPTRPIKMMALNFLSEQISAWNYQVVSENHIRKEGNTRILTTGPLAGQEVRFDGGDIIIENGVMRREYDSPYTNVDRTGQPAQVVTLRVRERHRFVMRQVSGGIVTETFKDSFVNTSKVFTKDQIEAMGFSGQLLADYTSHEFTLTRPNEATHLLNVSTDLEPMGEGMYWPNAYFNGRDESTFNFRSLIPHYATSTPDFVYRIRAYDTSTNADYPSPNYSGMGNYGKCLDIAFENEDVKPVRVLFGDVQRTEIHNGVDELVITFKSGTSRAAIGMAIEYKPLDGKKVENEMYINCLTGERTLRIFDLG